MDLFPLLKSIVEQLKKTVPIEKGGTGGTNRVDAVNELTYLGMNPITSTGDDTWSYWTAQKFCIAYFNQNILEGQPTQYGFLISCSNDGGQMVNQLFFSSTGRIWTRTCTSTSGWSARGWCELYNSSANMVLTSGVHYGDTLPAAGNKGRIFFKKL